MNYFRVHELDVAFATGQPRGIFVAIWKLLEKGLFTEEEEATYYENKKYFELNLPVPPFYESDNPEKAITWYKNNPSGNGVCRKMGFYFEMAHKYNLELYKTSVADLPGEVIYEDEFQIAVVNSRHGGDGFVVEPFSHTTVAEDAV